jgi:hypothetical protein
MRSSILLSIIPIALEYGLMELVYLADLLRLHVYRTSRLPLGSFRKQ